MNNVSFSGMFGKHGVTGYKHGMAGKGYQKKPKLDPNAVPTLPGMENLPKTKAEAKAHLIQIKQEQDAAAALKAQALAQAKSPII